VGVSLKTIFMADSKIEMTTLSAVMEKLRLKKFDNEFRIVPEGFTSVNNKVYAPADLKIIRTYRFEGDSNPDDNAILYLIEASDGLVGYSLDAYGVYSDQKEGYADFIRKIPVDERDEQQIYPD
jgi:hypothetical protein